MQNRPSKKIIQSDSKTKSKQDDKAYITRLPPHLLGEIFGHLDTYNPQQMASISQDFAEGVREKNLGNLIDLINLLKSQYKVAEESFSALPEAPQEVIKLYSRLLHQYQDKLKETIRDYLAQINDLEAYLVIPNDISPQICHLQNAVQLHLKDFRATALLLKQLEKFKASEQFIEFTPEKALIKAITTGNEKAIIILLTRKANVNSKDKTGNTPLMLAAKASNIELIKLLVKQNADPTLTNNLGETALIHATQSGALSSIHVLAEQKQVRVNVPDAKQWTALTWAVHYNRPEIAETLLEMRADPNSALSVAITNNNLSMANLLLSYRANPNLMTTSGIPLLIHAAQTGNAPLLKSLIANKASLNAKDPEGFTAFMKASNSEVARELFETGMIEINAKANNGDTALIQAVKNRHSEVVTFLLTHHAECKLSDKNGSSPLALACLHYYFEAESMITNLVEFNANINAQDNEGRTPLMRAIIKNDYVDMNHVWNGHPEVETVRFLLTNSADPNILDFKHESALLQICHSSFPNPTIIKLLSEAKANFQIKDSRGTSPLESAVCNSFYISGFNQSTFTQNLFDQNKESIRLLVKQSPDQVMNALQHAIFNNRSEFVKIILDEYKLDLNAEIETDNCAKFGFNPLRFAAACGALETVKFLINEKADLHATDKNGRTALFWSSGVSFENSEYVATEKTYRDNLFNVSQFLLEKGALLDVAAKESGNTPLTRAACCGCTNTVKLLIEHKADWSVKRNDGLDALQFAQKRLEELQSQNSDVKNGSALKDAPRDKLEIKKYVLQQLRESISFLEGIHTLKEREDIEPKLRS